MPRPRDKQKKTVKAKIHIFCEGEKTEPNYIRAYIEIKHPTVRRLKSEDQPIRIVKTSKNTPKQLVNVASKFVEDLDNASDQVWVIYDRESVRKYDDSVHANAMTKASVKGVKIAFSNVCFELWLLLHFQRTQLSCDMCDDVIGHIHFKQAMVDIKVKHYAKGQADVASLIIKAKGTDIAKANAIAINKATKATAPKEDEDKLYKMRPYTDVHKLLDAIDEIAEG